MADDRGGRGERPGDELSSTTSPTLYLLRHGKSAWDEAVIDRERALARRGVRAAALVGRFLSDVGEPPDRVLASNARRAHHTAELAAEAGRWGAVLQVVPELYGATATEVVELAARHGGGAGRLLVVGHEPAMGQTVGSLCGRVQLRFPTAAIARIELGVARWQDVSPGCGELRWLVTPRLLRAAGRR